MVPQHHQKIGAVFLTSQVVIHNGGSNSFEQLHNPTNYSSKNMYENNFPREYGNMISIALTHCSLLYKHAQYPLVTSLTFELANKNGRNRLLKYKNSKDLLK